ncbi:MAG: hypothetical protein KF886_26445 [Candidatus Hydrogenedentes bacterium]|nr:hypothetical protein [Candidatus Hydrogenedentota bacterium]
MPVVKFDRDVANALNQRFQPEELSPDKPLTQRLSHVLRARDDWHTKWRSHIAWHKSFPI